MSYSKTAIAIVTILLLSGCKSVPPPEPLGSNSSMIALALKNRAPIKLFSNSPDRVYFVRLEEGDNPNTAISLVPSNYAKGNYIYLLNAEPGRYAAVASMRVQRRMAAPAAPSSGLSISFGAASKSTYTTYFAEDIIEMTQVTVTPGSINFIGEYTVDDAKLKDADQAQLHYYRLIEPGAEKNRGLLSLFAGELEISYQGSLHEVQRDAEAEAKFLAAAKKHLGKAGWSDIITGRRVEVGTPPGDGNP